jgi:hypothetical protein
MKVHYIIATTGCELDNWHDSTLQRVVTCAGWDADDAEVVHLDAKAIGTWLNRLPKYLEVTHLQPELIDKQYHDHALVFVVTPRNATFWVTS